MHNAVELTGRWYEEGWKGRRPEVFKELAPDEFDDVTLATGPIDRMDEFLAFYEELVGALPDLDLEIERIEEVDGGTVTSWRFRGTHTRRGFGQEPTGRQVSAAGTTWQSVRDGKIVGGTDHWDFGKFLADLAGEVGNG